MGVRVEVVIRVGLWLGLDCGEVWGWAEVWGWGCG